MTRPLPTHWFLFGLACAAALPAAYTLDPRLDVDTWWHMAVGRWIVQNRDVPWIDPFSQMSRETPTRWYAYSWLYDLPCFLIFREWNYLGLLIFRTILCSISTAVVFAYLASRGGKTPLTLFMAFLVGIVLMMFAKERPWHFTIAATTITVWVIQKLRAGRELSMLDAMAVLIPLYILWANIHIQFVYGWFLLGLACLFPGVCRRRDFAIITAASVLATFVNPYHARLFIVVLEYASHTSPGEYISELAPPEWNAASTIATAVLLFIGFVASMRHRPFDAFPLIFLIVGAIFACRMRRDIWFAALASIAAFNFRPSNPLMKVKSISPFVLVMVVYATVRIGNVFGIGPGDPTGRGNESHYPCLHNAPLRYIRWDFDNPGARRCFNHFDMGGWLIWSHSLHVKVSIDGRTNLYGDERLRRSFQTWNCEGDWQHDPDLVKADRVFAPVNLPLTRWLQDLPDWMILKQNENAIVFQKRQPN